VFVSYHKLVNISRSERKGRQGGRKVYFVFVRDEGGDSLRTGMDFFSDDSEDLSKGLVGIIIGEPYADCHLIHPQI